TAAVGPATAAALAERGIDRSFVPSAYTTEALARELPGPPASVRLLRADIAGGELERILTERGFAVERVEVYRTEPADGLAIQAALKEGIDAVALTSASITRAYAAALGGADAGGRCPVFSIGPATSAACAELGLTVAAEASPHTILGLVTAMVSTLGSAAAAGNRPSDVPAE
ncbi:MAG TPA: uroporphyrinogen-III synthase, partial [Actinomycetota bacterium]|nr:uroporphyrinogen-III synthase [Actinomycetota bacterium]